jgi:hypothetical protein
MIVSGTRDDQRGSCEVADATITMNQQFTTPLIDGDIDPSGHFPCKDLPAIGTTLPAIGTTLPAIGTTLATASSRGTSYSELCMPDLSICDDAGASTVTCWENTDNKPRATPRTDTVMFAWSKIALKLIAMNGAITTDPGTGSGRKRPAAWMYMGTGTRELSGYDCLFLPAKSKGGHLVNRDCIQVDTSTSKKQSNQMKLRFSSPTLDWVIAEIQARSHTWLCPLLRTQLDCELMCKFCSFDTTNEPLPCSGRDAPLDIQWEHVVKEHGGTRPQKSRANKKKKEKALANCNTVPS